MEEVTGGPMSGGGWLPPVAVAHRNNPFLIPTLIIIAALTHPHQKSKPSYNNSNTLSFSSNDHLSPVNHPNSADFTSPTRGEEYDGWFYDDSVFGTVPSMDEVGYAISSLQHWLDESL